MQELTPWTNFYVLLGSSAGALIGLQFVVITLIATLRLPNARNGMHLGDVFVTPSIIHFGVVLFLSAVACVPWNGLTLVGVLWGCIGVVGMGYTIFVAWRLRSQQLYEMGIEDWLFHGLLPLGAYALLLVASWLAGSSARPSLFALGGSALLLLLIGIHNAWDNVTHMVFVKQFEPKESDSADKQAS